MAVTWCTSGRGVVIFIRYLPAVLSIKNHEQGNEQWPKHDHWALQDRRRRASTQDSNPNYDTEFALLDVYRGNKKITQLAPEKAFLTPPRNSRKTRVRGITLRFAWGFVRHLPPARTQTAALGRLSKSS